jgi:hypothetical protein
MGGSELSLHCQELLSSFGVGMSILLKCQYDVYYQEGLLKQMVAGFSE